jgi:flagellar biosynthesis protein FlhB
MKEIRLLLYIFIIGFLLNLVWKNAQAPLYEGYGSFWQHFMICFWASLVDAGVILLLYVLLAAWYRDFFWVEYLNWKAELSLFWQEVLSLSVLNTGRWRLNPGLMLKICRWYPM